jgi:hypothetical protein
MSEGKGQKGGKSPLYAIDKMNLTAAEKAKTGQMWFDSVLDVSSRALFG